VTSTASAAASRRCSGSFARRSPRSKTSASRRHAANCARKPGPRPRGGRGGKRKELPRWPRDRAFELERGSAHRHHRGPHRVSSTKTTRARLSQREFGFDTPTFASALRAALRQDPDVILVGEIRDPETMEIALMAAETGHLVLSTLPPPTCFARSIACCPCRPAIQRGARADRRHAAGDRGTAPRAASRRARARARVGGARGHGKRYARRSRGPRETRLSRTFSRRARTPNGMQTFEMHLKRMVAEGSSIAKRPGWRQGFEELGDRPFERGQGVRPETLRPRRGFPVDDAVYELGKSRRQDRPMLGLF